ncbi:MAG: VOC family protein [Treponema sp.]|jgi:lactoylglutathione lyase|nr:VOC family protein [Treponema sp.]
MFFRQEFSCLYVTDMAKSLAFYEEALGLRVLRRKDAKDREIAFIGNEESSQQTEIVHLNGRTRPYDHGENSVYFAFRTDDMEAARAKHTGMGCIDHDLPEFGVYFIRDPDGYLVEIMPVRK